MPHPPGGRAGPRAAGSIRWAWAGGLRPANSRDPAPPRPPAPARSLGAHRPVGGASGPPRLDPQPGSLARARAASSALAAPRSRAPCPGGSPGPTPPGKPGRAASAPRTHPSPTTTHLMACMGAGRAGAAASRAAEKCPAPQRPRTRAERGAERPETAERCRASGAETAERGRQGGRGAQTGPEPGPTRFAEKPGEGRDTTNPSASLSPGRPSPVPCDPLHGARAAQAGSSQPPGQVAVGRHRVSSRQSTAWAHLPSNQKAAGENSDVCCQSPETLKAGSPLRPHPLLSAAVARPSPPGSSYKG